MKTAFLFSGQGAQAVGMGKDLYEVSPAAKAVFDRADAVLGRSLSKLCFEGPESDLTATANCQPAIYTTSMACLAAWLEKNPGEEAVAAGGLSLGEYAAFASAGTFTFEDGLKLVAKRAALMDAACHEAEGGMAAIIGGDPAVIADVCAECGIDVANYNSPGQIVISGVKDQVLKACGILKERGVKRALPLNVAGAFHSRMMASAGATLAPVLDATPMNAPKFPVLQNFTGEPESDPAKIRANLVSQVAGSVRWDTCVRVMAERFGAERFVEFGPGTVLTGLVRKILPGAALHNVSGADGLAND